MNAAPKYILTERIAQGGMAEIYLGKSVGLDGFTRICAFKKILSHYAQDQEFIQMFRNEASVAKQLQNKNIVQVFDFVSDGSSYMLVMEYVEGQDLRSLLATAESQRKKIPLEIACYLMMEVLSGLHYAHSIMDVSGKSMGIIHRDVSPQNILVSYDGDVKLTDFGIAKAQGTGSTTRAGVIKGKFRYMSPEQAMGQTIDLRSDLFAAGVILWEMVTMQRLFRGEDMAVLEAVRQCKIKPPSQVATEKIPPELDTIIMKLLSRDLSKRYISGKEAARDINKFIYSLRPDFFGGELSEFMNQLFRDKVMSSRERLRSTLALPIGAFGAGGVFEIMESSMKGKTNSGVVDLSEPKARAAATAAALSQSGVDAGVGNVPVKPAPQHAAPKNTPQNGVQNGPQNLLGAAQVAAQQRVLQQAQQQQVQQQQAQKQQLHHQQQLQHQAYQRNRNIERPPPRRVAVSSSHMRSSTSGDAGGGTLLFLFAFLLALAVGAGAWVVSKKGSLRPAVAVIKLEPGEGPFDVTVNGKPLAKSKTRQNPLRIPLQGAREHEIVVNRKGFRAKSIKIELPLVGGTIEKTAALEPGNAPLVDLQIETVPPGARIQLEGQDKTFRSPRTFKQIPVGRNYTLRMTHPKCQDEISDALPLSESSGRQGTIARTYRFKKCK
jgi:serine/threonine protein kinase